MVNTKLEKYKIVAGQLLVHAAIVPMAIYASGWEWLASFGVYFLTMTFGISMLNHRYLSHRSIDFRSRILKLACLFLSTVALQGSSLAWVAMHREHHAHSDTDKDPHSPKNIGFWGSYFLSMMHTPNVKRFGLDLLRDKDVLFFHKNYWTINIVWSVLLAVCLGPMWVLVLHWIPAMWQWHGSSIVNALAHTSMHVPKIIGYRNFDTNENSKNLPLFAIFTFGEGWHNNHHEKPYSYNFQHRWFEIDIIAIVIRLLRTMRLVTINA